MIIENPTKLKEVIKDTDRFLFMFSKEKITIYISFDEKATEISYTEIINLLNETIENLNYQRDIIEIYYSPVIKVRISKETKKKLKKIGKKLNKYLKAMKKLEED